MDYTAPPLWGITNKASLFSLFSPKYVHAGLQTFMLAVAQDTDLLATLTDFNFQMQGLWECAHENPTACPNILKTKYPLLGRASKKHLRSQAAAELLISLWDNDHAQLKALLKQHLLSNFPLPPDADSDSAFNVLFTFRNFPAVMPDLNTVGSVVVSRSKSAKSNTSPKSASKDTSSDFKLDASAVQTPAVSESPAANALTLDATAGKPVLPPTPLANLDLYKLVEDSTLVFLTPSHAPKVAWLKEMPLVKTTKPKGQYPNMVNDYVMQLVTKKAEGILVGRLFFDYVSNDVNNEDIDYSVAYVQPGLITLPDPISDSYTNFLKVHWFAATHGDKSIPFENQLQYLNYEPPYVAFHSWDALNPRPTTVFSRQAYQNGLFIFPALKSLFPVQPELASEGKGALPSKLQSKKQTQADATKKSARRSASPPVSEKKRRTGASIKEMLMPVLEDVLEEVQGVPKPVLFLDSHGNWPLCRSSKCKKEKKYAVYSEVAGKKPAYCANCRPNDMIHMHYNNFRVYLQNKGELECFQVDTSDKHMCAAFGVDFVPATSDSDN